MFFNSPQSENLMSGLLFVLVESKNWSGSNWRTTWWKSGMIIFSKSFNDLVIAGNILSGVLWIIILRLMDQSTSLYSIVRSIIYTTTIYILALYIDADVRILVTSGENPYISTKFQSVNGKSKPTKTYNLWDFILTISSSKYRNIVQ